MGFFNLTRDSLFAGLGINMPVWLGEIIDVVIIAVALGFIFQHFFRKYNPLSDKVYDPLKHFKQARSGNFWFSMLAVAPAVVLHELGHKFVAMALGIKATLYASYGFLALGVILKIANAPFLFFIPGFVSHGGGTPGQIALLSIAGPGTNLVLWIVSIYLIRNMKRFNIKEKYFPILSLSKNINMFLFFFNMIPVPPFDGYHFFSSIFHLLF
ncbi:M50 family metallopeptidase [Candidatus Woesearchaeota archaeon]|nr:M50 family metallopeptidase [Candidatus Woesearchaeota archaeon]